MKTFEYAAPTSIEDALKLLGTPNAAALSGGTDLLSRMKDYVTSPDRVVNLKEIKALAGISGDPKSAGLTIGAGTRLADIVAHGGIREAYPALYQATASVGSPQIRNMATLGGDLLQRPHCWYFHGGHGLLAMKDGKSLVRAGDNRFHAIFLTDGDALFVSPSSVAVALCALDGQATIAGPKGERTVKIEELYQVPKRESDTELTIEPGEILTKVTVPRPKGKNASYEARHKQAQDWPLLQSSVSLTMDGETVTAAQVFLFGVAPCPWRSKDAERAITGKRVTLENAATAGEAAVLAAAPLSMNAYKVALARTVVKRALLSAVGNRYWEEA
ncbi:MAG: FAD binding domain-containing protein [Isosphaeraceae bacterium]